MGSSIAPGDRRCSDFVLQPAGALWSGFWNGNGAGANGTERGNRAWREKDPARADKNRPISSGHIAVTAAASIISTCAKGEEEGAKSRGRRFVLSSSFIRKERKWNWN